VGEGEQLGHAVVGEAEDLEHLGLGQADALFENLLPRHRQRVTRRVVSLRRFGSSGHGASLLMFASLGSVCRTTRFWGRDVRHAC
jgi:hypothetical protein